MSQTLRDAGPRPMLHATPSLAASERRSVLSVRSFAAFEEDDVEEEDGVTISDIFKRRSSLGTPVAETVASPVTFRKIWAGTANLAHFNGVSRGLIRSKSIQSNPECNQMGLITAPESSNPKSAETRSNSSPARSLLSHSMKSEVNSSFSSLPAAHSGALHGLQIKGFIDDDGLKPLTEEEFDSASFNLISPANGSTQYSLEARSDILFSIDHLKVIFNNPPLLRTFVEFLHTIRPKSIPLLVHYLDVLKALKAIKYSNMIVQSSASIEALEFNNQAIPDTNNQSLLARANEIFQVLAREYLPAYITHVWVQIVSVTIKRRVTDTLPVHLRDLSEGLAEVFCLTDPSRHGNPIIFASEEFHKMTGYGVNYVLGRNPRFLQGPRTEPSSVRRIREHLEAGKEHCEVFLNYRRDGSPFMNLLMVAPLVDSCGIVRYHIGAQIDVSGLAKECAGLDSLRQLLAQHHDEPKSDNGEAPRTREYAMGSFRELARMFSSEELKAVQEVGGSRIENVEDIIVTRSNRRKPRHLMTDDAKPEHPKTDAAPNMSASSSDRLGSVYENYLLVRPYPSLRILFASPSMRIPGILQSHFMSRVGGSQATREAIVQAFADGHGVTAKIRWVTRTDSHGKGRWIHCTPLLGAKGVIGVWMVVLVDDEADATLRRSREAPPVDLHIGGQKPFDGDG